MQSLVLKTVLVFGLVFTSQAGLCFISNAMDEEGYVARAEKMNEMPLNQDVLKLVDQYLSEKTKLSGTVDLFDSKENKVRNLKVIEVVKDLAYEGNEYIVPVICRDNISGETVQMAIHVENRNTKLSIKSLEIQGVDSREEDASVDPNKVYSDEEIQNYMLEQINSQAKITESFPLFDAQKEKLRNLQLVKINEEVRRYGILYVCSVDFKDKDTNEKVYTDMTVENKKGKLGVQGVRIRRVTKSKS